jgi:hypothetical protein
MIRSIIRQPPITKIGGLLEAVFSPGSSGEKLIASFDLSEFEISVAQYTTHYSPTRNGDVLDIVVHRSIGVSDIIVSDILESDGLPIIFNILNRVKIMNLSEPTEKFTDWDRFRSLASE